MNRRGFLGSVAALPAALVLSDRELAADTQTHPMGSRAVTQDERVFCYGMTTKDCKAGNLVWVQIYGEWKPL